MKLKVVKGATPGREFEIIEGLNLVGRSCAGADCHLIDLEKEDLDEKVSRRHAMIERKGETVILWDLGSLNGTYVNTNDKLGTGTQVSLKEGDKIIIGKTALVVSS